MNISPFANTCSVNSRYSKSCECGATTAHIWYGLTSLGTLYCDGCSKQHS